MTEYSQQEGAPKKGLSGWAWAGIGCGTVLLIGVIAIALGVSYCNRKLNEVAKDFEQNPERKAAEMIIGMHPEYSVLSSNDDTKEMTIKEDKTGKETTFSYKDIAEGKFEMTGPDGSKVQMGAVDLSTLPAWVKLPSDAKSTGGMQTNVNGKNSGVVIFTTALTAAEAKDFFDKEFATWVSGTGSSSTMNLNGVETITLGKKDSDKEISVMVKASAGTTTTTVTYSEK